jgi:hypothetical protein
MLQSAQRRKHPGILVYYGGLLLLLLIIVQLFRGNEANHYGWVSDV